MTIEEMKAALGGIIDHVTPEGHAAVSEILLNVSEELDVLQTSADANAARVQELTANNETLRSVNGRLLRRVGVTESTPNNSAPQTDTGAENQITFESLFNEKGDLL